MCINSRVNSNLKTKIRYQYDKKDFVNFLLLHYADVKFIIVKFMKACNEKKTAKNRLISYE